MSRFLLRFLLRYLLRCVAVPAAFALLASPAAGLDSYVNFETSPTRPVALSPDGTRLFVVNTPAARLEIFRVSPRHLFHVGSVAVGLDPVAVAARSDDEVWVVNHLSDSVSVVDVGASPPRVRRTLQVGDEPWDVVFAGPRESPDAPFPRAFVSAARRGQNHPKDPNAELKTPGVGRADVWVFDANDLGAPLGGTPETIVRVFGDKPRPLAASPDGSRVYVGIFHSGNRTTSVNQGAVCDGGAERGPCTIGSARADDPPAQGEPGTGSPPVLPGGLPGPNVDALGTPGPETGLIVKFDEASGQWRDPLGRNWNGAVPISLPDLDVFAIDALAPVPAEVSAYPGVGTVLFGMAVHPNGRVYVTNTDARNEVRFEGPGIGATTVRGRLHQARITILDSHGGVTPRYLNKHIEYDRSPTPPGTAALSLATPQQIAFSRDGKQLYVAAFGSSKIGVFDTREIDRDRFYPDPSDHIELSGGGPAGFALDERNRRLYVYNRFDDTLSTVDLRRRREIAVYSLPDPEPDVVRNGRRFLYDARFTSSNGEASCASCHIGGDKDDLAWDLGNPSAVEVPNNNPFFRSPPPLPVHPLKGPMTTQTLRGMDNHGPMHWRGDRSGANDPASGDAFDEIAAFRAFNGAFESLLGRDEGPLEPDEMQAFAEFALTIVPPPTPIRPLDNSDPPSVFEGRVIYNTAEAGPRGACNDCHTLDRAQGFFGATGLSTFDPGDFKIPQLFNIYDKVGMFSANIVNPLGNAGFASGDQVRGFGTSNDGSSGDIANFLVFAGFNQRLRDGGHDPAKVEDFVLAFPSLLAPIVGQQVTRTATSGPEVDARIDLMIARAQAAIVIKGQPGARECALVAKGVVDGEPRGWSWFWPFRLFLSDRDGEVPLTDAELRALADVPGQSITYTCTPPGSGIRLGIDADEDGVLDADARASHPFQCRREHARPRDRGDWRFVELSDRWGSATYLALPPARSCSPAELDRVVEDRTATELECRTVWRWARHEGAPLSVDNAFGDGQTLVVGQPRQLCEPVGPGRDPLLCYDASADGFEPLAVTIADRLDERESRVTGAESFCTPVGIGGAVAAAAEELVCYSARPGGRSVCLPSAVR